VSAPGAAQEVGEFAGAKRKIAEVPSPIRRATEKARDALLVDLAARRDERAAGRNPLRQGQKVVLVAARAVQQQERRPVHVPARNEAVDEAEIVARVHVATKRKRARVAPRPS